MRNVQTSRIIFNVWIPTIIMSLIVCITATLVQVYVIDYQFVVSIGVCAPPLACSVVWNCLLSRRLKLGRQNSRILNRKESLQVLDRATFIINATILAHAAFLIICTITVFCTIFFHEMKGLVIALSWLLRLMYLLLFTVEGHVYLSKVKPARDLLKKKILHCLCSLDTNKSILADEEDETTMQSSI